MGRSMLHAGHPAFFGDDLKTGAGAATMAEPCSTALRPKGAATPLPVRGIAGRPGEVPGSNPQGP